MLPPWWQWASATVSKSQLNVFFCKSCPGQCLTRTVQLCSIRKTSRSQFSPSTFMGDKTQASRAFPQVPSPLSHLINPDSPHGTFLFFSGARDWKHFPELLHYYAFFLWFFWEVLTKDNFQEFVLSFYFELQGSNSGCQACTHNKCFTQWAITKPSAFCFF